jgi:uncharacterized protein with HEPN domain
MSLSPLEYLRHILDETKYLSRHTPGLSKAQFLADETLKRAFVRSIEIIGEATKQINVEVFVLKRSSPSFARPGHAQNCDDALLQQV